MDWNNNVNKIWDKEFFCNLKILELKHFPTEYSIFPSNFLERISPSLEELTINDAFFEEIFSREVTANDEESSLRRLNLCKIHKLRHLIKDQTRPSPFIQNLDHLEVLECTELIVLMPSPISFQNLKSLKVSKCHGLLNLINSSIARNLSRLTRLAITECEMVEEIVASEGDEAVEAEIGFDLLEYLELYRLPKLGRFCSGNATFKFPCL